MIDKINIRVYAIYLNEKNELMALDEGYAGEKLIKLPGGGLEFGEGTIECLHREFAEELNLKIEVLEHFYTQEDFLVSRFRENEQLLTILGIDDLRRCCFSCWGQLTTDSIGNQRSTTCETSR